jgi:D-ribose pyranase
MKKHGILNADLARAVAAMGHRDLLVIGDAGLPAPRGVPVIDLALREGVPGFLVTLATVLEELRVEEGVIAEEMAGTSPALREAFASAWPREAPLHEVGHEEFKRLTADAKVLVRTGEFTPYANVALVAGVVF